MSRLDAPQLRPTLWPGVAIELPAVVIRDVTLVKGEFFHYGEIKAEQAPPSELCLRELLALDVSKPDALVSFQQLYGPAYWTDDPTSAPSPWNLVALEIDARYAAAQPSAYDLQWTRHQLDTEWTLHVARALTRCWLALCDDTSLTEAWRTEGFDVQTDESGMELFVHTLNRGLRDFHVRLEFEDGRFDSGEPRVGIYPALCLQLANLMADGLPPKKCANETCSVRYVRQQGRSVKGQFRTEGVIYCSRPCAKAQAERERRRRRPRKGQA